MATDSEQVTLCMLVARPDVPFLRLTVPHLVRGCRFNFARRLLIVDTLAPARHQTVADLPGSNRQLLEECRKLCDAGVMDELIELGADADFAATVSRNHFGKVLREQRDFRGIPLLGWAYGIEKARTDYVLHFDSDNLLYQSSDYDWISEGIKLLRSASEIAFISPLPGPPTADGSLNQDPSTYMADPRGFFAFNTFSSRRFLLDRRRLRELLPLELAYSSPRRRLLAAMTRASALWNWEAMMSNRLQKSRFVRAHLRSKQAWTIHAPDHGEKFLAALPMIIASIEQGTYPRAQAGKYDLLLNEWM